MKKIILMYILVLASTQLVFSEDILQKYSSIAKQWRIEISNSFDFAEKEVYNVLPDPSPNNDPVTDPDPKKCACKGTGKIKQGDDHVTPCPYHGQQLMQELCPDGKCNLKTTCQCETKCGCKPCKCKKLEIK